MICKNCSLEIDGKYCQHCGQKASTKRFDAKIVFSELLEKLMPFEKGVLFTSIRLLTAPGASMREYLAGKRVNYSKPISYTLLIFAFSLIFFSQQDFQQGMQDGFGKEGSAEVRAAQKKLADVFTSNVTLMYALLIPFLALASKWVFRKYRLHYAEYLVIDAYYTSGSILLGMPIMIWLEYFSSGVYNKSAIMLLSLIYLAYFVWAYTRFFKEGNIWSTGLRAIAVYVVAYVLYTLFIALMVAVAVGIWA